MSLFEESIKEAPIVKKGDYPYVIHPITDGIPEIKPELLREVADRMEAILERYKPFDKIVTMEAMGIPLATALSLKMDIPFTIIRKRSYGLPDEVEVSQVTGYSKSKMYINGLKDKDRIVIVDDVLSTGGTLKAVLRSLENMNVDVKTVVISLDKGDAAMEISKEVGIPIHTLVHINVKDDEIVIG
ncbi:MAG: adenine phosphoribosyltransferase [Thermoplasmata archaeon]|nr:MAG: adenine phosphoribosyltransferase [Thermoplasmata archaeon]HEC89013.1 purine phosphoribosyltransferase family protein [Thermoplasmatales archaeon]